MGAAQGALGWEEDARFPAARWQEGLGKTVLLRMHPRPTQRGRRRVVEGGGKQDCGVEGAPREARVWGRALWRDRITP